MFQKITAYAALGGASGPSAELRVWRYVLGSMLFQVFRSSSCLRLQVYDLRLFRSLVCFSVLRFVSGSLSCLGLWSLCRLFFGRFRSVASFGSLFFRFFVVEFVRVFRSFCCVGVHVVQVCGFMVRVLGL